MIYLVLVLLAFLTLLLYGLDADRKMSEIAFALNWPMSSGGIRPEEMQAFLDHISALRIQAVIESGRGRDAYSTGCIADYKFHVNGQLVFISIDWEHNWKHKIISRWKLWKRKYRGLFRLVVGDAWAEMPRQLDCVAILSVALLIDGPKAAEAVRLASAMIEKFSCIRFVAIHGANCPEWHQAFPVSERVGSLMMAVVDNRQEHERRRQMRWTTNGGQ